MPAFYIATRARGHSPQKRLRPFRIDGGRCGKGVPSSGEKLFVSVRTSSSREPPAPNAVPQSFGGGASGTRPAGPPAPRPPVCTVYSAGTVNKVAAGSVL